MISPYITTDDGIQMFLYMTLSDGTEMLYSRFFEKSGKNKILVQFRKEYNGDIISVNCELPDYKWGMVKGFSKQDISFFEEILRNNEKILYDYCQSNNEKTTVLFTVNGYKVFFCPNKKNNTLHVHISNGKLITSSTKIWLTQKGECVFASNGSCISQEVLNEIMVIISAQFSYICEEWKKYFMVDEIDFYC